MEIAEVRRRVRAAIERSRRDATARRERSDQANRVYDRFLTERAVPAFHALASALTGEGRRFTVETPARSVRLTPEASRADFLELTLDDTQDPPIVLGRMSRGRGRRQVASERPVRSGAAIDDLTEEDVIDFALQEIAPFLEG